MLEKCSDLSETATSFKNVSKSKTSYPNKTSSLFTSTSTKSTPTLDNLISEQSSNGNWNDNCYTMLEKFFTKNSIKNDKLLNKIKE